MINDASFQLDEKLSCLCATCTTRPLVSRYVYLGWDFIHFAGQNLKERFDSIRRYISFDRFDQFYRNFRIINSSHHSCFISVITRNKNVRTYWNLFKKKKNNSKFQDIKINFLIYFSSNIFFFFFHIILLHTWKYIHPCSIEFVQIYFKDDGQWTETRKKRGSNCWESCARGPVTCTTAVNGDNDDDDDASERHRKCIRANGLEQARGQNACENA